MNGTLKLALLAAFVIGSTFAKSVAAGTTTFVSPCECQGQKSGSRWPVKTDPSPVPSDKSTIQSITPSQIYEWKGPGPNVSLTPQTDTRIAAEQKWYNLTGRLVGVKVENDGDITLVLKDAEGKKAGNVGAEIPVGSNISRLLAFGVFEHEGNVTIVFDFYANEAASEVIPFLFSCESCIPVWGVKDTFGPGPFQLVNLRWCN